MGGAKFLISIILEKARKVIDMASIKKMKERRENQIRTMLKDYLALRIIKKIKVILGKIQILLMKD